MKMNYRRVLALALAVIMVLTMAACGQKEKESEVIEIEVQKASLQLTLDEWPKIDGATALAPYYEAMASALLDMDIDEARQYVLCNKTDGAFENIAEGKVDMIFCSLPGEAQEQMLARAGVELERVPFLNGAFVFFVNKDNPVDSLTVEQLHDIYAGKITNWSEVGGDDVEIIPYQRSEGSGSQNGLYRYIIPQNEVMEAPSERMIGDMAGIIDVVSAYDNSEGAIGYSYYYYVANMHYSDRIKLLAIDGVVPSDKTIAEATYPIINQSYVMFNKNQPEGGVVRAIVDWICSEEGQKLGEENGYVRNADLSK